MKRGGIHIALRRAISIGLLLALAVPGLASAQHQGRPGGRGVQQQQQGPSRPMMPPAPDRARDATWRNNRQAPPPQGGRMSEAERQQLRRDISDHGRDIYGSDRGGSRRQ